MPARIKPRSGNPRRRHFIKEWRLYRGLTQEQLAERMNSTKANISKIENLQQSYTQDFLEACAEALMTDAPSLLMRRPGPEADTMWSLWESAAPADQDTITELARTIVRRRAN